jgi:predicted nuclease of predicted toxin-antitoxin system
VNLFEYPLLADENIHHDVIAFLSDQGCDVFSIAEDGHFGMPDAAVLRKAQESGRVVLTHDRDFGGLAILNSQPYVGIIFLRPGHISAEFTIETIKAIQKQVPEIESPFILVAERSGDNIRIRIRQT